MANPDCSESGELPRRTKQFVLGAIAAVVAIAGLFALGMKLRRRSH